MFIVYLSSQDVFLIYRIAHGYEGICATGRFKTANCFRIMKKTKHCFAFHVDEIFQVNYHEIVGQILRRVNFNEADLEPIRNENFLINICI